MLPLSYLSEKRLVDLHSLVRALRQDLSPAMPAVADGRVGIGNAAQEHSPLIVELLLSFSYTLVYCHHRVIKVCERKESRKLSIKHFSMSCSIDELIEDSIDLHRPHLKHKYCINTVAVVRVINKPANTKSPTICACVFIVVKDLTREGQNFHCTWRASYQHAHRGRCVKGGEKPSA